MTRYDVVVTEARRDDDGEPRRHVRHHGLRVASAAAAWAREVQQETARLDRARAPGQAVDTAGFVVGPERCVLTLSQDGRVEWITVVEVVEVPRPAERRVSRTDTGWSCHQGHMTTPPARVGDAEWRLCPTCQQAFDRGESDESGVIVLTGHGSTAPEPDPVEADGHEPVRGLSEWLIRQRMDIWPDFDRDTVKVILLDDAAGAETP